MTENASGWTLIAHAPRAQIEAALLAHEDAVDWDSDIVLAGSVASDNPDPHTPELWRFTAFLPRAPTLADIARVTALFAGTPPVFTAAMLPDIDWVTQSQAGLAPVYAGRFCVYTPENPPKTLPAGIFGLCVPASRAFGTGHHATTAGCLAMLSHMRGQGMFARNIADIGTGSGVLALAASRLWPRALVTAADIDDACLAVVAGNAARNQLRLGAAPGTLAMVIAPGLDHPLLAARGPYDLITANILAAPLITLAGDLARALVPGGSLVLAGLLAQQEPAVRAAYRRAGLRLAARAEHAGWSVLWLRKRRVAKPWRRGAMG